MVLASAASGVGQRGERGEGTATAPNRSLSLLQTPGANTGIGLALTKQLVGDFGCRVYLGSRCPDRGAAAVEDVRRSVPAERQDFVELLTIVSSWCTCVQEAPSISTLHTRVACLLVMSIGCIRRRIRQIGSQIPRREARRRTQSLRNSEQRRHRHVPRHVAIRGARYKCSRSSTRREQLPAPLGFKRGSDSQRRERRGTEVLRNALVAARYESVHQPLDTG